MRLTLLLFLVINLGSILLNHGIFWDDWKIFNMSYEGIEEQTWAAGMYTLVAQSHYFLQQFDDPSLAYRIVTVISYLLIALFGYLSLTRILNDKTLCLIATLIFIINPFYAVRNTMVCLPYTVSLVFFVVGFYLFLRAINGSNIFFRILSLAFFYLSFLTNSLLCLYAIVPIYLFINLKWRSKLYVDFLLLPILFWIVKVTVFPMHGLYEIYGHNQINIQGIIALPKRMASGVFQLITSGLSLLVHNFSILLFVPIVLLVVVLIRKIDIPYKVARTRQLASWGILLLILGILPYALVNKFPSFNTFETRNQLLIPFGFVAIALAIINVAKKNIIRQLILGSLIVVCTYMNLMQQHQYLVGWMKYEALLSEFREMDGWNEMNTIEVVDQTPEYNPTNQEILFFEWNGMAKYITKTENRLFIPHSLKPIIEEHGSIENLVNQFKVNRAATSHNMTEFVPNGKCTSIAILRTNKSLNEPSDLTSLIINYHFDRDHFNEMISSYLLVKVNNPCEGELN